jgi:hypothetical protein
MNWSQSPARQDACTHESLFPSPSHPIPSHPSPPACQIFTVDIDDAHHPGDPIPALTSPPHDVFLSQHILAPTGVRVLIRINRAPPAGSTSTRNSAFSPEVPLSKAIMLMAIVNMPATTPGHSIRAEEQACQRVMASDLHLRRRAAGRGTEGTGSLTAFFEEM